jgi:hypothetical protein
MWVQAAPDVGVEGEYLGTACSCKHYVDGPSSDSTSKTPSGLGLPDQARIEEVGQALMWRAEEAGQGLAQLRLPRRRRSRGAACSGAGRALLTAARRLPNWSMHAPLMVAMQASEAKQEHAMDRKALHCTTDMLPDKACGCLNRRRVRGAPAAAGRARRAADGRPPHLPRRAGLRARASAGRGGCSGRVGG